MIQKNKGLRGTTSRKETQSHLPPLHRRVIRLDSASPTHLWGAIGWRSLGLVPLLLMLNSVRIPEIALKRLTPTQIEHRFAAEMAY